MQFGLQANFQPFQQQKTRQIHCLLPSPGILRPECDVIPHTFKKLYKQKGVMHPCTVVEETANTAHRIRAKRTTSVMQIYLLMLPCQTGHSFPSTRSTWVICGTAAAAEVTLCIRRTWSIQPLAKGEHQTRKKETPPKPTSSAEHTAGSGYDQVIALPLSAHTSSRSALMHSLKTDTACVLQSAQLQTKAPNY